MDLRLAPQLANARRASALKWKFWRLHQQERNPSNFHLGDFFNGRRSVAILSAGRKHFGDVERRRQAGITILNAGTTDFYWKNSKKISAFYSGVGLSSGYVTGNNFSNRTWSVVSSNEVAVTSHAAGLPDMTQYFTLDQNDSFLTSVSMSGSNASANWMGPVVVNTTGGVDIGSYNDDRALFVPFDNDDFVRYNAMPINSSSTSYEVGAFYDNTTRNGLVVGSVTHDVWKSGVYFSGSNNKLNQMNVFGGNHLAVGRHAARIRYRKRHFVTHYVCGFRQRLANDDGELRRGKHGVCPATRVDQRRAVRLEQLGRHQLPEPNHLCRRHRRFGFHPHQLAALWFHQPRHGLCEPGFLRNLQPEQLAIAKFCQPLPRQRPEGGHLFYAVHLLGHARPVQQSDCAGLRLPLQRHPAPRPPTGTPFPTTARLPSIRPIRERRLSILNQISSFIADGFDYLKVDFLSHGALEGVHYDTNVTTGIEAYNQGMQFLLNQVAGKMFISESIAPLFPYQYGDSRRIACDAYTSLISNTEYTMNSVTYGWWLDDLYPFNDPDFMVFDNGPNSNEDQSRLINCAITGVFLNGSILTNSASIALAQTYLTNAAIDAVARTGQTFTPVEGNTGTSAANIFVRQDGITWCIAVFNYTSSATNETVNLSRAGLLPGTFAATNLWDGTVTTVSNSFNVSLNAKQAKLFRLGLASGVPSPEFVAVTPAGCERSYF